MVERRHILLHCHVSMVRGWLVRLMASQCWREVIQNVLLQAFCFSTPRLEMKIFNESLGCYLLIFRRIRRSVAAALLGEIGRC